MAYRKSWVGGTTLKGMSLLRGMTVCFLFVGLSISALGVTKQEAADRLRIAADHYTQALVHAKASADKHIYDSATFSREFQKKYVAEVEKESGVQLGHEYLPTAEFVKELRDAADKVAQ